MREFSDFEKEILSIMVELQKEGMLCRWNILCKCISDVKIEETIRNEKGEFLFKITSGRVDDVEMQRILSQLSFLYNYLSQAGYIQELLTSLLAKNRLPSNDNLNVENRSPVTSQLFFNEINQFLELMLSETIVNLVKNDFKTIEQRRHSETKIISWVAIGISLLLGLLGYYTSYNSSKASTEQAASLQQTVTDSKTTFPETINIQCNDTLNVRSINTEIKK